MCGGEGVVYDFLHIPVAVQDIKTFSLRKLVVYRI